MRWLMGLQGVLIPDTV